VTTSTQYDFKYPYLAINRFGATGDGMSANCGLVLVCGISTSLTSVPHIVNAQGAPIDQVFGG
jgi:hypothetical protein